MSTGCCKGDAKYPSKTSIVVQPGYPQSGLFDAKLSHIAGVKFDSVGFRLIGSVPRMDQERNIIWTAAIASERIYQSHTNVGL